MEQRNSLLPLTRIVLFVSMLVQAVLAFAGFFAPDLTGLSTFATQFQYTDGFYLAGAIGALYALLQDNWIAARTYLAIEFIVVASFVVITILNAAIPPGIQPITWTYFFLSILFLPTVVIAWRREAAGGYYDLAR